MRLYGLHCVMTECCAGKYQSDHDRMHQRRSFESSRTIIVVVSPHVGWRLLRRAKSRTQRNYVIVSVRSPNRGGCRTTYESNTKRRILVLQHIHFTKGGIWVLQHIHLKTQNAPSRTT